MHEGHHILLLIGNVNTKAELPQEGILFHTQFPSLGFFFNKKVGFRKKQDHIAIAHNF